MSSASYVLVSGLDWLMLMGSWPKLVQDFSFWGMEAWEDLDQLGAQHTALAHTAAAADACSGQHVPNRRPSGGQARRRSGALGRWGVFGRGLHS